jgi:hypothetical protein
MFEVMTSPLQNETLGSVASLLAATLFQGNPDRNLRDIYSICRCYRNLAAYTWKVHNEKIEIISSVVMFWS